jgi:zinc protease
MMIKRVIAVFSLLTCGCHLLANPIWSGSQQSQPNALMPSVYYDSLLNGLQIQIVERPDEPTATVSFLLKRGAAFDRAGKEGTADLTARLLLSRTRKYDDKTLDQHLREVKATLDVVTTWDATTISAQLPAESISPFLRLLAWYLFRPAFSEAEFVALKQQSLADLQNQSVTPSDLTTTELQQMLFEPHPYARPIKGTKPSVEAIELVDVETFYRRFYLANDAALIIVGNVSAEAVASVIRPTWGALRRGKPVPTTFAAPGKRDVVKIRVIDRPELNEAQILVGVLALTRKHEHYPALLLRNHILGGSNPSRLTRLAHSFSPERIAVASALETRSLLGALTISISARPQIAPAVVAALLQGIKATGSDPITEQELIPAKRSLVERLPNEFRANRQLAEQMQAIELYGLPRDHALTLRHQINQVTPEQINKLMEHLFTQTPSIVVVGRAADMVEELKKIENSNIVVSR